MWLLPGWYCVYYIDLLVPVFRSLAAKTKASNSRRCRHSVHNWQKLTVYTCEKEFFIAVCVNAALLPLSFCCSPVSVAVE